MFQEDNQPPSAVIADNSIGVQEKRLTASQALGDLVVGIDHIAVAVVDLQAAIRWYTQKLGFQLIEERLTQGERTSMLSAVVAIGGAVIVLVQGTSPESQVTRFVDEFGPGVQHIALSVTDIDRALTRVLASGGAADTPVFDEVGIRQVFLRREPDSAVRYELIERRGGDFSDKSVERLFRTFEANDLY